MKVWMLFVQGDGTTWLEAAWDDDSTAGNDSGWVAEVDRVRKMAAENRYEWRCIEVEVPGVFEAFEIPKVQAAAAPREAA